MDCLLEVSPNHATLGLHAIKPGPLNNLYGLKIGNDRRARKVGENYKYL